MLTVYMATRGEHAYKGIVLPHGGVDILDATPCPHTGYIGGCYYPSVEAAELDGFTFRRVASDT